MDSDFLTWFFEFLEITPSNISEFLKEFFGWEVSPTFIKCLAVVTIVVVGIIIYYVRRKLKTKKWRGNLIEQKLGTEFRLYSDKKQSFFKRVWSRLKESSKNNIYVETRFQSKPPHDKQDPEENIHSEPSESLMKFYLEQVLVKNNTSPFLYCVLAGSGMGKTTFAINLLKKYINKYTEDTIPFDIFIFNLGNNDVFDKIKTIKTEERPKSILILDALDENTNAVLDYDSFKKRLEELIKDFRIVIITCRTQFFDEENKEPNISSLSYYNGNRTLEHYHNHYISVFNEKDIKKYLKQKYSFNIKKRKKATSIVRKCNSLMVRPLLLSYIEDLLQENEKKLTTVTKIYEILIEKWINREVEFWETKNKNQISSENLKKELYRFSEQLAKDIYEGKDINGGFFIPKCNLKSIIKNFIYIDYDFKGRSLVNRDVLGNIKFSHKSFLEYFLARLMFKGNLHMSFEGMDMAKQFYLDFCDEKMLRYRESAIIIHTNDNERVLHIFEPLRIESWMRDYFQHIKWLFVSSEVVPSLFSLIKSLKIENVVIYNFGFNKETRSVDYHDFLCHGFLKIRTPLNSSNDLTIFRKTEEMNMIITNIHLFKDKRDDYDMLNTFIREILKNEYEDTGGLFQTNNEGIFRHVIAYEISEIIVSCCGNFNHNFNSTTSEALFDLNKLLKILVDFYRIPINEIDIDKLRKCNTLNDIYRCVSFICDHSIKDRY